MNKEQDYASDTDESDEDFHPDKLAGDSAASEDEEADDSEANGESSGDNNEIAKENPVKRKKVTKKQKTKKKSKTDDLDESEDDDNDDCAATTTSRRATRQTDDSQKNGKGKCLEKDELVSDDEDKSRTNELWADFLKDVKPTEYSSKPSTAKVEEKPSSSSSSSNEKSPKESKPASNETLTQESLKPKVEDKKIVVTEVVDFAGEEVRIEREVDASSIKENKAASIPPAKKQPFGRIMPGAGIKRTIPSTGSGSSGGLGSLLNQLGKKKKLSVLEKSQMDWNSFKQTEGIDEQLQTFNKGKDGYLERQDFLQRTDLRQFEIEKNLRQTTRRPF